VTGVNVTQKLSIFPSRKSCHVPWIECDNVLTMRLSGEYLRVVVEDATWSCARVHHRWVTSHVFRSLDYRRSLPQVRTLTMVKVRHMVRRPPSMTSATLTRSIAGLSFSVPQGVRIPPSLRNVLRFSIFMRRARIEPHPLDLYRTEDGVSGVHGSQAWVSAAVHCRLEEIR
jgi:hypothetical protein